MNERRRTIGVIGNASRPGTSLPERTLRAAYEVGRLVAESGSVLVSGGTGGIMAEASRGASEAGGLTVGFLPQPDYSHANPHLTLAFPTGMGTLRNVLTARCSDALIMIGGGVGTLNEVTIAYDVGCPVIVVAGTGGWADRLPGVLIEGAWLDERRVVAISFAEDAAHAVALAHERLTEPRVGGGLQAHLGAAGH